MPITPTKTSKIFYILSSLIFIAFSAWWILGGGFANSENELFSDTYWVLPLLGGAAGLWAANKWGGVKSLFGKSIFLLALGLSAQVFGQVVYSIYALALKVEVPYPSIGDVGFFGSVLLYIAAIWLLAKTAGVKASRLTVKQKVIAIALPLLLLSASYWIFLKGYEFDWANPLVVLLDFGYPLGQAIYVSLALLTYFLSMGLLGGIMKKKILFLLGALLVQYVADYLFLYQNSRETWYAGGISDYIYLVAYFLMTLSLLRLADTALALNRVPQQAPEVKETEVVGS